MGHPNKPKIMSKNQYPDKRLTTCSNCKYGIFEGHEYKWSSRGLIHVICTHFTNRVMEHVDESRI